MQLFANNALSTLAAAITNVDTSMSVQPGHGARFPSPTGGDYFLLTLFELVGGIEANHEIVKVTARSVDTLTIVRAQESTAARAFIIGSQASHRATAGSLSHLAQADMPTTFTQPVTILTAAPGTNTTQAASTAFVTAAVSTAVAALVASSPAALDTLNELAAALGNDANYATTISTALGNRLRVDVAQGLSAPQKAQGVANLGLATVATSGLKADVGLGNVDNTSDANKPVSTAQATAIALKLDIASPSSTGTLTATSADATFTAKFKGASGVLRVLGYVSAGVGAELQSVNAAENAYIPFRVTSTATTLAFSGGTNTLTVDTAGTSIVGLTNITKTSAGATVEVLSVKNDGTGVNTKAEIGFYAAGTKYAGITGGYNATAPELNIQVSGATVFQALAGGAAVTGTFSTTGGMSMRVGVGSTAYFEVAGNGNTPGVTSMLFGQDGGSLGYVWNRADAGVVFATNSIERGRFSAAGNFLVGTTTDNGADKLQVNGSAAVGGALTVTATGNYGAFNTTSASNGYHAYQTSGTAYGYIGQASAVATVGTSTALAVRSQTELVFCAGGAGEDMRLSTSGLLLVGVSTSSGFGDAHRVNRVVAQGSYVLTVDAGVENSVAFMAVSASGTNGAGCAMLVGKNSSTSRSINAGGTINASGADYAEYMVKAANCGLVEKGAVVGVTAEGEVTDRWLDAVSFMVKTTNPSYVGGDTWGAGLEGDELEAARQTVDRIAFAGQVPVNVYGAKPGQIILPARFGDKVGGIAVNASTLSMVQYMRAVGIVQNILPDGRANIRVKVA